MKSEQGFEKILREGLRPAAVPPHVRETALKSLALRTGKAGCFSAKSGENPEGVHSLGRASDSPPNPHRSWRIAAGLVLALAVGAAAGRFFFKPSTQAWTDDLIADYVEMLARSEPEQIVTSSAREVEGWFHGKLPFVFSIPRLNGAELLGARLCKLKMGLAGLIFYEVNGGKASLFVLNGQKIRLDDLEPLESPDLHGTASRGVNLVSWEDNGIVYALVSGLDRPTLMKTLRN